MVLRFLFACLITVGSPSVLHRAHNLGIHGLSNANPSGDPTLPEIRGAFEAELKARFFDPPLFNDGKFANMFEYSVQGNDHDTIFFGQKASIFGPHEVMLRLTVGGTTTYECKFTNSIAFPFLHSFKFGVDQSNTARIYQDDTLLGSCPAGAPLPVDIARNHFLKAGTYQNLYPTDFKSMDGGIVGLQVTNLATPQHPTDLLALRNLPSQTFSSAFVASFYARFDNDSPSHNIPLFDFGNVGFKNIIRCEQLQYSTTVRCFVLDVANVGRLVLATNSVVKGEYNFWHFHVANNGTMTIEKDGAQMGQALYPSLTLPSVFRSSLLFGERETDSSKTFNGVILGFRLDRDIAS